MLDDPEKVLNTLKSFTKPMSSIFLFTISFLLWQLNAFFYLPHRAYFISFSIAFVFFLISFGLIYNSYKIQLTNEKEIEKRTLFLSAAMTFIFSVLCYFSDRSMKSFIAYNFGGSLMIYLYCFIRKLIRK